MQDHIQLLDSSRCILSILVLKIIWAIHNAIANYKDRYIPFEMACPSPNCALSFLLLKATIRLLGELILMNLLKMPEVVGESLIQAKCMLPNLASRQIYGSVNKCLGLLYIFTGSKIIARAGQKKSHITSSLGSLFLLVQRRILESSHQGRQWLPEEKYSLSPPMT